MKLILSTLAAFAVLSVQAVYHGDIVQYWVDQSSLLKNGSYISPSEVYFPTPPPFGWSGAIILAAVHLAAVEARGEDLAFQQLAVSHAAHNALIWVYHGTRLYSTIDNLLEVLISPIGLDSRSPRGRHAIHIGRDSARRVLTTRADDGNNDFVEYFRRQPLPGVFQPVYDSNPPSYRQGSRTDTIGGLGDPGRFMVPPHPDANATGYEAQVLRVRDLGGVNSTARTPEQTETAYLWEELAEFTWTRLAHTLVGNSLANNVLASARLYAQLNYAILNAYVVEFINKEFYHHWRPITAIHRTDIWLASGRNVSDPSWQSLLPTPNALEYPSGRAAHSGAAAAVLRAFNGGSDDIDVVVSTNSTALGRVITRRYTSLAQAANDSSTARVYHGAHFQYSVEAGNRIGRRVGEATVQAFTDDWYRL